MGSVGRLPGLLLGLLAIVAISARGDGGAPVDKPVFPLVKEGEQWWVGVRDLCALLGATFEGEGLSLDVDREQGIRVRALVRMGGDGPFLIKSGEDRFEFRLNQLEITKNGDYFGDFLFAPRRIEGVVAATLEDLGRILEFQIGEEVYGQPTISIGDNHYRLVKGEPLSPLAILGEADKMLPLKPENWRRWRERLERLPFDWKKLPSVPHNALIFRSSPGPGYTEHNGLLYYRGGVGLQVGPEIFTPSAGQKETLYGPVLPNRFQAEGRSGDLTYLSIVERLAPSRSVVWMTPRARPHLSPGMPRGNFP